MTTQANENIPVVDVDQAFPAMVDRPTGTSSATAPGDVAPQVSAALRDVLGWRPRAQDPKAFVDALSASFQLDVVEGHVQATFVPRGYAVQADLGAVSGGQASLYRRADVMRTEMLRILDGLKALRTEGDSDDMESYRILVRTAISRVVDELGAAGGPRIAMVDSYFRALTGLPRRSKATPTADTVAGQLGALRDRFGLGDDNVNTVEEEGARTAMWTLVDMVTDLRRSWNLQAPLFENANGTGFIGTDLVRISRLMEATADQVAEVEAALDSVLISLSERRTIDVNDSGLTLDGLLTWIRAFLTEEGRQIAQDTGRDGIVSSLAPTVRVLAREVRQLSRLLEVQHRSVLGISWPVVLLPVSCPTEFPAGMSAARSRIALASLCRLLCDLEARVSGVGRWAQAIPIDLTISHVGNSARLYRVSLRGYNLHERFMLGFIPRKGDLVSEDGVLVDSALGQLVKPVAGTATYSTDGLTAMYHRKALHSALPDTLLATIKALGTGQSIFLPAEDLPLALLDGETGRVVNAPLPVHWPSMKAMSVVEGKTKRLDKSYREVDATSSLFGIPDPGVPLVERKSPKKKASVQKRPKSLVDRFQKAFGGDKDVQEWVRANRELADLKRALLEAEEAADAAKAAQAAGDKSVSNNAVRDLDDKVTEIEAEIRAKDRELNTYREGLVLLVERVLLTTADDAAKRG